MARWNGYMAFMAEAPMIGVDPMPAWSPDLPEQRPTDGPSWAELYMAGTSMLALVEEAEKDAIDRDDEPDVVFAVAIEDDGSLLIHDHGADTPFTCHTADAIYQAFGMTLPELS